MVTSKASSIFNVICRVLQVVMFYVTSSRHTLFFIFLWTEIYLYGTKKKRKKGLEEILVVLQDILMSNDTRIASFTQ